MKRNMNRYATLGALFLASVFCVDVASKLSKPLLRHTFYKGIRISYAIQPNSAAPLLFFIHGAPGSWKAYRKYLRNNSLSTDFEMISVDRPGYGGTENGRAFASLKTQSHLLGRLLRLYAKERPVILVGHSYGGPLALRMAMDYPNQVDGLLLLAPTIDPSLEKRGRWRMWIREVPLRWLTPTSLYTTNEEIISLKTDLEDIEENYLCLKVPVYYIHGTSDMIVPVANQYYAKRQMSHLPLQLRILEGVNHFIPWTNYSEVIKGIYYLRNMLL